MTRRIVLAGLVTTMLTGGTAVSLADVPTASTDNVKKVCIVVFGDPSQPSRDGVCVWTPPLPLASPTH